ncbi:MAG: acetolactate synthase large subunit [Planctomycetota bacterium]|nr:MAG: acetolactate synthase large subunit [Planctomycetota bacterium]
MWGLARSRTETLTGGEALARMLRAEGVDTVFGIIDGSYFGLYSALAPQGIRLVSPRHEASAAHMAGAYARLTGRLGVCMASNGPGLANMLGAVAVEHAEGNRVLLLTSCRRTGACCPDRGGTFQCFEHTAVTRPITKWAQTVPSAARLPELMRKALRACFAGRPGVVHLDVPEDVLNDRHALPAGWLLPPARYRNLAPLSPAPEQLQAAARLVLAARRPLIHAGAGVIHALAHAELAEVSELLQAPVITSWAGRGAISELSPLAVPLGALALARRVRTEADCVLIVGSRLGETDWWGKPPHWAPPAAQRAIQVDIEEGSLGLNRPLDLAVLADARQFLAGLAGLLREQRAEIDLAARRAWLEELQDERARAQAELERYLAPHASPIHSAQAVQLVRQLVREDAIVVLDGGNTAVWGHFFCEVRQPGTLLGTPKMGMLGAGVGQALGAAVAFPQRQVVALMGDGAMGMHLQELETAVRHRLRAVFVVFCDRAWGMVKMGQQIATHPLKALVFKKLAEHEYTGTDFAEIRFDLLAEAMGARGERARAPAELEQALARALVHDGPSVIHLEVDPVRHMWAPGLKAFKEMHLEPAGS